MAGLNTTEELRREIQALAAENEELKQLVQLLMENHDLKTVLRSQDSVPMSPFLESTRIDSPDQADSGSFRFPLRLPRMSTPPPGSPPMTPVGPRPIFMGQLSPPGGRLDSTPLSPRTPPPMFTPPPLSPGAGPFGQPPGAPRGQRMQPFPFPHLNTPPPVARLNLQSPNMFRSPDSGMQGAGYITPDSSQEFSFRSGSSGRLRGRGYCVDCPVPFHPHIPVAGQHESLADSLLGGRMNQSGNFAESSQDSSFG